MQHNLRGEYGRVRLAPLEEKDIEYLRILRNNSRENFEVSNEISSATQIAWFGRYLEKPDDYMFSISFDGVGVVGFVAVYDVSAVEHTAEVGRLLIDGERAPVRGLGRDAISGVSKIAFELLVGEAGELRLFILESNIASSKTCLNAGYIVRGGADPAGLIKYVLTGAMYEREHQGGCDGNSSAEA